MSSDEDVLHKDSSTDKQAQLVLLSHVFDPSADQNS